MPSIMSAKGVGGEVELHRAFVRIKRNGVLGTLSRASGMPAQLEIPLIEILKVNLRVATALVNGHIHFVQHGTSDAPLSILKVGQTMNALAFNSFHNEQFQSLKEEAETLLAAAKLDPDAFREVPDGKSVGGTFPENLHTYEECTRRRDWRAICDLNQVNFDHFMTRKELVALPQFLEQDEIVFALTSGLMKRGETSNQSDFGLNSWLVVLTSERFLFMDAALFSGSVDIQSVRHEHVQAISFAQGFILGKVMIDLGSRVVTIDNCVKDSVIPFGTLGNKWHKSLQQRAKQEATPKAPVSEPPSLVEALERIAKLHAAGVLSDDEYKQAKTKILGAV